MSDGAAWADEAFAALNRSGRRTGGAREAVVEELARGGGGVTAQELVGVLTGRAGAASVYRALQALAAAGALQRVDVAGAARYELVRTDGRHRHHLVCRVCGRTDTFADDGLERAIDAVAAGSAYAVEAHDVVLHGVCPACAG